MALDKDSEDENPYKPPESPPDPESGVPLVMPSAFVRVCSMVFIGLGVAFATLALVIISELIRLRFGADSIFEDPPVPTWMALISTTFATVLIGFGIFLRRASSRKRTQLLERR